MSRSAGADGVSAVRTVHALVSGRVQGVGYRWSCLAQAQALGLVGQVRNLPDGDVEVLAQGGGQDVDRLVAWLHRGPRWASVARVAVTDLRPGSLEAQEFTVEY